MKKIVKHMSKDRATLFLAAIVVGLAHIVEHWVFAHSAFTDVPDVLFTLFQKNFDDPNLAFLVFISAIVFVWIFSLYGAFRGGRAASIPLFLFGLFLIAQSYHLVREWEGGLYHPGIVTGAIMVGIGILLLREGLRALRGNQ
ncbi:hypothetical protein ACJ2A9_19435 [Anaerobacillus sp. MEB173]|uniref:hypothetical protein n=1 Tax=Anaerobacillus sp. MEB173 TaxID=3383345 RepID=UPI003F900936